MAIRSFLACGVICRSSPTDRSSQSTLGGAIKIQSIIGACSYGNPERRQLGFLFNSAIQELGSNNSCTWNEAVSTTAYQLVRDSNIQFPIDKLNRLPSHCDGNC
jgi:hypothetical protein